MTIFVLCGIGLPHWYACALNDKSGVCWRLIIWLVYGGVGGSMWSDVLCVGPQLPDGALFDIHWYAAVLVTAT